MTIGSEPYPVMSISAFWISPADFDHIKVFSLKTLPPVVRSLSVFVLLDSLIDIKEILILEV